MFLHDINICFKCEDGPQFVTLQRCWRCLDLLCEHNISDGACIDQGPSYYSECKSKEKKKVLWAWRDELNKSGVCVSYTYSFDECCKELNWTESGDWVCTHCKKNIGKIPPPDSCAGCAAHSVDPNCPIHGYELIPPRR